MKRGGANLLPCMLSKVTTRWTLKKSPSATSSTKKVSRTLKHRTFVKPIQKRSLATVVQHEDSSKPVHRLKDAFIEPNSLTAIPTYRILDLNGKLIDGKEEPKVP